MSASSACGGSGNGVSGSVVASGGRGAGCESKGHVGGVRSVLNRADVMLCAFPFACSLITAVLQGPSVCGNEMGDEKCVGVAPVPSNATLACPVQAPGTQMTMRAENVSPPGAVPD